MCFFLDSEYINISSKNTNTNLPSYFWNKKSIRLIMPIASFKDCFLVYFVLSHEYMVVATSKIYFGKYLNNIKMI
jgi:hypothetical protein